MTCPSCESNRIVIVLSEERRSFCTRCGTRWRDRTTEARETARPPVEPGVPENTAS